MSGCQPLRGLDKEEVRSTLDVLARDGAQRMLISALEQEVEEFLGRARYEHGAGRRLAQLADFFMSSTTVALRLTSISKPTSSLL